MTGGETAVGDWHHMVSKSARIAPLNDDIFFGGSIVHINKSGRLFGYGGIHIANHLECAKGMMVIEGGIRKAVNDHNETGVFYVGYVDENKESLTVKSGDTLETISASIDAVEAEAITDGIAGAIEVADGDSITAALKVGAHERGVLTIESDQAARAQRVRIEVNRNVQ